MATEGDRELREAGGERSGVGAREKELDTAREREREKREGGTGE